MLAIGERDGLNLTHSKGTWEFTAHRARGLIRCWTGHSLYTDSAGALLRKTGLCKEGGAWKPRVGASGSPEEASVGQIPWNHQPIFLPLCGRSRHKLLSVSEVGGQERRKSRLQMFHRSQEGPTETSGSQHGTVGDSGARGKEGCTCVLVTGAT